MSIELNKESVEQAGGDERAACNLWIAEQHLCQGSDISLFKLERNGALVSLHELLRDAYQAGQARAALAQPSPALAEQATADDYEEVLADHRRLVRELDVLLNGEACAAKQAMLCDLVSQVEAEVRKSGQPLLVSAERYRWLRNDDNWGADDSEGQGTSKWANLGELSGTDFDAYLDQLRGSNPVMDIDPEHSKAIAKRGPMTEGRHSPGGCTSLEEFAPNPAQAQSEQAEAERPEVVARVVHSNPVVLGQCGPLNANDELMTVAQHAASVARWAEMFNRVEQQRDAALVEVERLRESKGDPVGSFEKCMKVMYERDEHAKRLEVAQARVAELEAKLAEMEKQVAVAWGAFHFGGERDGKLYTHCETEAQIDAYILDMHRSSDSLTLRKSPLYAAPVAQAQQLNDLDKQCRDDVARALGLRPNQERGFAWSYLLASIKSCVKASGDSAQAQHSVPEEFSFEYRHPNGESHTVTVSRDQVISEMPDFLFEALCSKFCNCEPVGETNVVECCCDEYAEEFKLLAAAPGCHLSRNALTEAQMRRLYENSTETENERLGFEAFARLIRRAEAVHQIAAAPGKEVGHE